MDLKSACFHYLRACGLIKSLNFPMTQIPQMQTEIMNIFS